MREKKVLGSRPRIGADARTVETPSQRRGQQRSIEIARQMEDLSTTTSAAITIGLRTPNDACDCLRIRIKCGRAQQQARRRNTSNNESTVHEKQTPDGGHLTKTRPNLQLKRGAQVLAIRRTPPWNPSHDQNWRSGCWMEHRQRNPVWSPASPVWPTAPRASHEKTPTMKTNLWIQLWMRSDRGCSFCSCPSCCVYHYCCRWWRQCWEGPPAGLPGCPGHSCVRHTIPPIECPYPRGRQNRPRHHCRQKC